MSHEHSYQHDLDNVIDASDAVLAIGTEKVDTTTLKDRSLNGNDATIHGAMPSNGYFLGRRFSEIDGNNILSQPSISADTPNNSTIEMLVYNDASSDGVPTLINKSGQSSTIGYWWVYSSGPDEVNINWQYSNGATHPTVSWLNIFTYKSLNHILLKYDNIAKTIELVVDGVSKGIKSIPNSLPPVSNKTIYIGTFQGTTTGNTFKGIFNFVAVYDNIVSGNFNTIARLSLYSHNFTQYPNSDTSLTTVFPYTSGIITSGSFNKTDGLKCTSAGTIIFSNNFEFDGSEYLTLTIDGVEYSGTTTVTQGTITATIAQGSNDITIDMGTGDVLPDIRVQFREEV